MRLLGWNYRGIYNASTIRALRAQIKRAKPDFIFLSETKALFSRMDSIRRSINFDHLLVVEAKGKAGGLCMMWKSGWTVKQAEYNKNLIAMSISDSVYD